MKKMGKVARLASLLVLTLLFGLFPIGSGNNLNKVQAVTPLNNPRTVADSSMNAKQKVTWDCVWFGAYPQSEVTSGDIYNKLKNATGWDENNDIMIGETKYRRLKGEDATYATSGYEHRYDWNNNYKAYHYFKYEPIKWRVLNRNGNDALLLADVALDSQMYNTNDTDAIWEISSMRSWLNGYGASVNQPKTDYSKKNFINSAFTSIQKNAIKTTNVVNNNNINYEVAGGKNTSDQVFLLSTSEVYNTDTAAGYGFVKDSETDDEARRSRCSTYAYAMGTWRYYDTDEEYTKYNGNVCWWLRSRGYFSDSAISVDYGDGLIDLIDGDVTDNGNGVRPALHLNLSSTNLYSYAGTVCSDAMKSGESGTDNSVKPSEPDESDTPNQPTQPDKPGTATGTRTEESDVDIEIDGGVDFTIPENVPILGGGDVSLDYGTIPVTFKREDNTYRIGIGVQDMNKKDWTTFKKFVETQKESYRKGMNSLLASKFGTASMGMSVEPEMEAYGYVEGTITKKNGVESAGGKLVVEIKGTAKQEWQTFVVVVPVVIKVKGTAGTKADFSVGFDFNKSKVYTKGKVELTLPSVRLTGGIGVSYIADISVYGEAKNLVTVESDGKDNDVTASLEGALGVSAKALCFSYEKEFLNGSFDYLTTKKKSKARMYARALPKLEPEAKDYEIQRVDSSSWDGSAVAEQTAKPRSIKRAASAKNTSGTVTTLLSDVYASAKPQLLQTASGKKLLIFTTDMGDRTTGNHTAVVYSIYNERGWSIPKLIDDDGTADFDAVAAVDGENVYVTWINAKRTFTPEEAEAEDFMTKLAAETEVQAAKIALNGNTGTVTKYPAITDNAIADLHPSITVKNHVPYIAWNSNSANDILKGTGTNTVYLASLNGNAFTTKKLSEENKPVQSVAIGNLDNDVVTAYTLNSGTEENPQVQLTAVNAKGRTTIAKNGQNVSPSFAKIDGSSVLLWYAQDAEGSSLNYIDAIDGEVESYIEDDAVISADYTVVDGGDSQLLICSSEKENAEEAGRNLYAYVIRDGEVYEPVTLTDLEGYAAVPSGIWNGTAYEYLFTRADVNITENTVKENTDLCITSVVPQSRLVIGDIDYTQEEVMPDADASITVPVKNNGLTNCGEGKVQIVYNGNVIGQADLEAGITSGETQNVTVDLTVPEDAAAKETLKVEAISDKNTTADSTKNIQSAGSELALSVKQEDDDITVAIDNNSAFDTTAALTLKAGDASGKVLKTINLGNVESYGMVEKTFTKEELKKLGFTAEEIKSTKTLTIYDEILKEPV